MAESAASLPHSGHVPRANRFSNRGIVLGENRHNEGKLKMTKLFTTAAVAALFAGAAIAMEPPVEAAEAAVEAEATETVEAVETEVEVTEVVEAQGDGEAEVVEAEELEVEVEAETEVEAEIAAEATE